MPTDRLAALPSVTLPGGLAAAEAVGPVARLRGLAGLPGIEPGEALLLRRCRSVHTVGMRFALDLLWLDGDDRVVRVDRSVPPGRVRACARARGVVERAAR